MRKIFVAGAALLCVVLSVGGFAQTTNATLGGTVSDPSRALIPGVTVTATNTQTGIAAAAALARSNQSGLIAFKRSAYSKSIRRMPVQDERDRDGVGAFGGTIDQETSVARDGILMFYDSTTSAHDARFEERNRRSGFRRLAG
jgi:hypothetical protein